MIYNQIVWKRVKSGNNQEEPEESIFNGLENINSLEELAKHGARIILSLALKNEIDDYIEKTIPLRDGEGRRLVYRNGYHREREIQTEIGGIAVKQPRVDSRKSEAKFDSRILPKCIRRTESIDAFILILYLNPGFPSTHNEEGGSTLRQR